MKLSSQALELQAIRTMAVANAIGDADTSTLEVNSKTMLSSMVFAAVDESFFHSAPAKAAFRRLSFVARKKSQILSYEVLCEESAIDEDYRDVLREADQKRCKTKQAVDTLIEKLDEYRKARIIANASKDVLEKLQGSSIDIDTLLTDLSNAVGKARSRENLADAIHTLGKNGNAYGLINEALNVESDRLIPTGLAAYDSRCKGLPSEGVMLMAGTTSGGKSVIRMNLARHFYEEEHRDVLTISLEMSAVKEVRRQLSQLSGIDFRKFVDKTLTEDERAAVKARWKKFSKSGKKNDCRFSLFCPTRSIRIEQLLLLVKPYGYQVIILDYVSLLEGVDEDNQPKMLSNIIRQCKIFSTENKCLVIVLAQLDSQDDRIRYSRGMLEHADVAWTWNYSKPEQRDLHEIPMNQRKGRDGEVFAFPLKEEFHIMRVTSDPESGSSSSSDDEDDESDEPKPKKRKSSDDEGDGTSTFNVA